MKVTTLLSVIMSTLLLPVPSALSQRAGQHPDALTTFTNVLDQDGFEVSLGAPEPINPAAEWCATNPALPHAFYANDQPYLKVTVPKSAQDHQLTNIFQMREDEAIVMIERGSFDLPTVTHLISGP